MSRINLFSVLVIAVLGCLCLDIKYKRELNYDSHWLYFLDEYRAHEPRYQRSENIISELNKIVVESSSHPGTVKKNFEDMLSPDVGDDAIKMRLISATQTITQCLHSCPVISDYRPVCGTNGVTYHNLASLLCARTCSVVVDVMKLGPCFSTTTTAFTTTTTITAEANKLSVDPTSKCIQSCDMTLEENPICGTDGVTYKNFDHLFCVIKCGTVVHALRYGKCTESNVQSETWTAPILSTAKTFKIDRNSQAQCLQNCPVTLELHPVCGSDGITYANSGRLICAKFCGIDVAYEHQGNCLAKIKYGQMSSEKKRPPIILDDHVADRLSVADDDLCLRNCQISSNFYPVCGTNGVTYTNIGQLLCASSCGFHVRVKYKGVCAGVTSTIPTTTTTISFRHSHQHAAAEKMGMHRLRNPWRPFALSHSTLRYSYANSSMMKTESGESDTATKCMKNCPVTSEYNPVCGSDTVTYDNFGKLLCARNCGVAVKLISKGGCRKSYLH